jgi:hypothetical protein
MGLRLRGRELRFDAGVMERLLAGVELQIGALLGGAAEALSARMALAMTVVNWETVRDVVGIQSVRKLTLRVALVFEPVLVFLVATVALRVVGLGLACTATVLALLDGATLGVDVVQFAIYGVPVSLRTNAPHRR